MWSPRSKDKPFLFIIVSVIFSVSPRSRVAYAHLISQTELSFAAKQPERLADVRIVVNRDCSVVFPSTFEKSTEEQREKDAQDDRSSSSENSASQSVREVSDQ